MACLDEAMRLSLAVGGLLPRETLGDGLFADGEWFPAGIDIGVPHYALQHNELYHPDSFEFDPSH